MVINCPKLKRFLPRELGFSESSHELALNGHWYSR